MDGLLYACLCFGVRLLVCLFDCLFVVVVYWFVCLFVCLIVHVVACGWLLLSVV